MRKLLSVTTFTGMLTLLRMAAGFLMAKVIAVYLGPSGMAMLGQVQNIVAILNGIITAPISPSLIRFTAQYYDGCYKQCVPWWRASLGWVLIFMLILIPLMILFSHDLSSWLFSSKQYSYLVLAIAFCLPFSALGIIINAVNNGVQNYKKYIGLGMLSVIVSTAIMIFLVMYGSVKGALLAISIQNGIIGIVLFICSVKEPWLKISYWVGAIDRDKFLHIFRYILMALISALVFPLSLLIIRNTLIDLEGWNVTGQWQAVWKISDAYLSVMTLALSTYYLPLLSKLDNLHDLRKEIRNISKVIIPVTILLSSLIYFSSGLIVNILFTEEFKDAESLFLIQLIGDNVKIIAWLYAYPLIAYGVAKWYIIAEISFAILFTLLGRLLISNYGVSGANWAYLLSYIIYFCFVFIVINKVVIFSRKG